MMHNRPARCRIFHRFFLLLSALLMLHPGCHEKSQDDFSIKSTALDGIVLPIADRGWDQNRPDTSVGWCAEACIQMAMGYFGKEVTQEAVNKAGRSSVPDLHSEDIETALDSFKVSFVRWNESVASLDSFVCWIREQLRAKHPVICGMKLYPDENPSWAYDHFALAVGFNKEGILMNTNLDGQQLLTYRQLSSMDPTYSFRNGQHQYFARAISGIR
jgi:Peptidase_C39 like family